jgi:VanZ family protein
MSATDPSPIAFLPQALRSRVAAVTRGAFWFSCAFVLWSTLTDTESLQRGLWDKGLHFTAFYGLAVMGAVAFPELRLRWIGLGLLAFGLGIEVLQKYVGRDASWLDFLADGAGVAFGLAPIALDRLRRQLM